MARESSLATMSIDSLLELRDKVGMILKLVESFESTESL